MNEVIYDGWVSAGYSEYSKEYEIDFNRKDGLNSDLECLFQRFLYDMFCLDEAIELFEKQKDVLEEIRNKCINEVRKKYIDIAEDNFMCNSFLIPDFYEKELEKYIDCLKIEL